MQYTFKHKHVFVTKDFECSSINEPNINGKLHKLYLNSYFASIKLNYCYLQANSALDKQRRLQTQTLFHDYEIQKSCHIEGLSAK